MFLPEELGEALVQGVTLPLAERNGGWALGGA